MKVVYISNAILPSKSANSIHIMKMCQALADNGHEVTLLAPNYKDKIEPNVSDIFRFYGVRDNFILKKLSVPNIKGRLLLYISGILFFLIKNKFDYVYSRFIYGSIVASILRLENIYESHAPICVTNKIERWLFSKLIGMPSFKRLVVISGTLKRYYLEKYPNISKEIQVAHDGADPVSDFDQRAKLEGNPGGIKVGYIGHLYRGKGIEVIENICDKVPDDIEFHIVGGTAQDVEYWKSKCNSSNVFFYGFVPQKDVSSYINALDICLLPNQKVVRTFGSKGDIGSNIGEYTSPLKLFDYMSHRKAIISSNHEVLCEVLNTNNCLLVGADDFDAWVLALERLREEGFRNRLAEQAFRDFSKYSWKNRAKNILGNAVI
ncbi:glycosyltransferase family 4 protein [Salinivibrio costicola]|uniref:Glycosyltransferase family 4 protein n=1 Tax=Salinivibrio costicola TaxID=51367 RepID=A0ABX6K4N5_SALCS|nr:glycosyltransferase family 4 protein [Salinivibrio costicola]QIR06506.1 glycosyltransferase family 4 protein [Salinivibrio costicola]